MDKLTEKYLAAASDYLTRHSDEIAAAQRFLGLPLDDVICLAINGCSFIPQVYPPPYVAQP